MNDQEGRNSSRNSTLNDTHSSTSGLAFEDMNESRYLVFRLGTEIYGTPLLGIRELLQPQKPKAIPNTVSHFKGLINVRGQVIGVVDLRARFDYPTIDSSTVVYLLFETETGPLAAIVDKVEAVIKVDETLLQKKPNIRTQVPVEFLIGATSHNGQLITLIDFNLTLSKEDFIQIRNAKLTAAG